MSSNYDTFNEIEEDLDNFIEILLEEKEAYEEYNEKKGELTEDVKIFEDFFEDFNIETSNISLNNFEDVENDLLTINEKFEELDNNLEGLGSKEFIETCNSNFSVLDTIEENFKELYSEIKKVIIDFKKSTNYYMKIYENILRKIAEIKENSGDNEKKEEMIVNIDRTLELFKEQFNLIDEFLNIESGFTWWRFEDEYEISEEVDLISVERSKFQMTQLENDKRDISGTLATFKDLLVENCPQYGEFYITLNEILEQKHKKNNFSLADLEDEEQLINILNSLEEENLRDIIYKLSEFGLIKSFFSID